jgi:hypothetical protein
MGSALPQLVLLKIIGLRPNLAEGRSPSLRGVTSGRAQPILTTGGEAVLPVPRLIRTNSCSFRGGCVLLTFPALSVQLIHQGWRESPAVARHA